MKSYFVLACLLSIVYGHVEPPPPRSIDWDDPKEAALCKPGRDGQTLTIRPAKIPFLNKQQASDWLAQNQMCYFAFVNEAENAGYPDILKDVVTKETKVCWGDKEEDCEDPMAPHIAHDITTLRDYVDLHSQKYVITEFKKNSFKVTGKRYVKMDPDLFDHDILKKIKEAVSSSFPGFAVGKPIENEFEEEYVFDANGKLKRRVMITQGNLAKTLLEAGLMKYAHFAKSIGQSFDIPERFKYDGDNVYYIQFNNIAVIAALIIVVGLTFIMFCYSLKIMKSCLCDKKKVHRYHKVIPKEAESTSME